MLLFQVQNEQCQEVAQADDQKWITGTNNGEWDTHTVSVWLCPCGHDEGLCVLHRVLHRVLLFLSGESKIRYEHLVLEDHRHPGGREDGQTCVAQEHPDRG